VLLVVCINISFPFLSFYFIINLLIHCDFLATAPAAGLYPLWEAKEKTKFLVIVTDEEENSDYNGHFFTPLLEKYFLYCYF
jgi:hypothetical protein